MCKSCSFGRCHQNAHSKHCSFACEVWDSPVGLDKWVGMGSQLSKHPPSCVIPNSTKVLFQRLLQVSLCSDKQVTQKPSLSSLPPRRFCFSLMCPSSWMSSRSKALCGFRPQDAHSYQLGRETGRGRNAGARRELSSLLKSKLICLKENL